METEQVKTYGQGIKDVLAYIENYAWLDEDKNAHVPTLLHDIEKDFREFL